MVILFDDLEVTDAEKESASAMMRKWLARRQVLERRKRNIDAHLEVAVEKTKALGKLTDEFAGGAAKDRVRRLRANVDDELHNWKHSDGHSGLPYMGYMERMARNQVERTPVGLLEHYAEEVVDLVLSGYEGSILMFRLVVDYKGDARKFVAQEGPGMGLERRELPHL